MYKQKLKLMSVLSEINQGKMDNFDSRLYNQKAILIIQNMGISELNYNFGWYLRGPYSSELTNDLFEAQPLLNLINKGDIDKDLIARDKSVLSKFKSLLVDLEAVKPNNKSITSKLEYIASISFIARRLDSAQKKLLVLNFIKKSKWHLSNWPADEYWRIAEKYALTEI